MKTKWLTVNQADPWLALVIWKKTCFTIGSNISCTGSGGAGSGTSTPTRPNSLPSDTRNNPKENRNSRQQVYECKSSSDESNFSQSTNVPRSNVTLQKYSVITTDFNTSEAKKDLKDNENKFKFVESLKDKSKLNYHNNNRNDADSIDDNCSNCRTDTNTNMSNNNIKVSNMY